MIKNSSRADGEDLSCQWTSVQVPRAFDVRLQTVGIQGKRSIDERALADAAESVPSQDHGLLPQKVQGVLVVEEVRPGEGGLELGHALAVHAVPERRGEEERRRDADRPFLG